MTDLVMPKAGITMDEGTVVTWLVKPGDAFKSGQPVVVVETDKATIPVEASADGVLLEILVAEGKTVPVGTPIARVGSPGEVAVAPAPGPAGRLRISPLARRLAATLGVNPAAVSGTGPGGRVLRRDIEAAHRQGAVAAGTAPAVPVAPAPAPLPAGPGKLVSLTRMRRSIAERMVRSAATIPQFRVSVECDVSSTAALRESLLLLQVRLSFTDFLLQAVSLTLREHPRLNASFVPEPSDAEPAIELKDEVNVGLAVALDAGLVVPVLRGADRLSLIELSREREALVQAARAGRLTPDQISGGTFTISNLGAFGVLSFDAIINPPEAAILAVGQIVKRPVATESGAVAVRPMLILTLTADHRVLDGAEAARFLGSLAARLSSGDRFRLV